MSFVVMAIGAAHSLPPIIGAILSKSKTGTLVGAAIATLIAFASGNPVFVVVDLVGVGLGTWLGLSRIGNGV
jgi:hypothetical protein